MDELGCNPFVLCSLHGQSDVAYFLPEAKADEDTAVINCSKLLLRSHLLEFLHVKKNAESTPCDCCLWHTRILESLEHREMQEVARRLNPA